MARLRAMEFLSELGLFAAKAFLLVVAIVLVIGAIAKARKRGSDDARGTLRIKKLDDRWKRTGLAMKRALLPNRAYKELAAEDKKKERAAKKAARPPERPRIFVVDFDGNMRATQVAGLREEINAILLAARDGDEVVVRLKSPGGVVHGYGLCASQLERVRERGLELTVTVDQVAASGGYMMAVVANTIVAAPFAVLGSIGVVAGLPNFHRWLERRDIDFELLTAGKYKRTLTVFGKNSEEGRRKFQEDLDVAHGLFKQHIARFRPKLDLEHVATGEHWYGRDALALGLVDEIGTSDDYLLRARERGRIYQVKWVPQKKLFERFGSAVEGAMTRAIERVIERAEERRFP